MEFKEKFIKKNIATLCKHYDSIAGVNKNYTRISPDLIDGVKLGARRMLYLMYLQNGHKEFNKVATIVGDTIGKLHMHGDMTVYNTLVGLGQWWNNNIPLIEPDGNYGSIAGDPAGASRYIKGKISDYAYECFFSDWKDSVVDMRMGADAKTLEPLYLPAKYPNVLINASMGIGFGMSSNIPPFNFREVIETTILLLKNPNFDIVLVPDSPTGCDIVENNFKKICDTGKGTYTMRCKYEVLSDENVVKITNIPYQTTLSTKEGNGIIQRIAEIKEKGGLAALKDMQDLTQREVDIRLELRDDINPYKFMKKLISEIPGLEKTYPVDMTVVNDYKILSLSIKGILLEWIKYRRDQKRIVINHKRSRIDAEMKDLTVKIFVLSHDNLEKTLRIFKSSRNRSEVEATLVQMYRDTEIRMDSIRAKTISDMKFHEATIETYEKCVKKKEELQKEYNDVEEILNSENGIDKIIIAELRDGAKRFGTPRKSNVVPQNISIDTEIEGSCILQLSCDGMLERKTATNVDEEAVPTDSNGFALYCENDSGFIAIDENGNYDLIKVKEIPVDNQVPLNRYIKKTLSKIVAMLPYDLSPDKYCTLISKRGMLKKIRIADIKSSKKACLELLAGDKLVAGIVTTGNTSKDILIYTNDGRGQRLDPNNLRVTSCSAKGLVGFNLKTDE